MLTPEFELQQDDGHVLLTIRAPYVKANDVDWLIDGNVFRFHIKPYFLRLCFQQSLANSGLEQVAYDINTGHFTFKLPKETPGEHFEGLDLHNLLLRSTQASAQAAATATRPSIEVLSSTPAAADLEAAGAEPGAAPEEGGEDDGFDWEVEQELASTLGNIHVGHRDGYGFDAKHTDVVGRLQANGFPELTRLADPENVDNDQRAQLRVDAEEADFDEDYYWAECEDFYQLIVPLLRAPGPHAEYVAQCARRHTDARSHTCYAVACAGPRCYSSACRAVHLKKGTPAPLPKAYRVRLEGLPKRELLPTNTAPTLLVNILDLLLTYCYEYRIWGGDLTPESVRTMAQLSSTLSHLQLFTHAKDVLQAFGRRALCYPLRRHWVLVVATFRDVQTLFAAGKRALVMVLLDMKALFDKDEVFYPFVDLFLVDAILWLLQHCPERAVATLAEFLASVPLSPPQFRDLPDVSQFELPAAESESGESESNSGSDSGSDGSESDDEGDDASATDSDDVSAGEAI
ncbi:uncharacterized protein MONBRDRAFT_38299 [Monosiga brevicollis MX1]|uniref:CS domain-containing protein n=1 Tax=Monosiga brevicollis TaxID=81824 RepID=A9V6V3_MONBE|nr:uncharacterized protein MONBRDRAFT_38299 [Monosiga brevicollis MX1]EDQ86608.1 predicted protein [Monosiga brevicollis MX1]|eukprot:XP_001748444.1 hypothetical protein [Monosiga brevicollis MX1]